MNRDREVTWLSSDRPEDDLEEQSKGETIIVAESGGHILGFVSIWVLENFVHHLYVHLDHQGRGVGRLLLEEAARICPGDLTLKCVKANQRAMTFYRRTGWTEASSGVGPEGDYALFVRTDTNQNTA